MLMPEPLDIDVGVVMIEQTQAPHFLHQHALTIVKKVNFFFLQTLGTAFHVNCIMRRLDFGTLSFSLK
ncbi:hypothetical protein ACJX0J_040815, partial [Zea mays]